MNMFLNNTDFPERKLVQFRTEDLIISEYDLMHLLSCLRDRGNCSIADAIS